MKRPVRLEFALIFAFACLSICARSTPAQTFEVLHQVEGRIHSRTGVALGGIHVRIMRKDSMQPIGETFTRPEGNFVFTRLTDGDYLIETFETDVYESTLTDVALRPIPRRSIQVNVFIELPLKSAPATTPAGVITADVDLKVPKEAVKFYRAGTKALEKSDSARAIIEFQKALTVYPDYYAAGLDLGRELRLAKRYKEAEEVLKRLPQIAPRRAEPRIEYGIVLLELRRTNEAAAEMRRALQLEETNWAAHLYLGWALLESHPQEAEPHFKRALELNDRRAARAHLALARLANEAGQRELAIQHLDAFLSLAPEAPEAEAARKLAAKLRQ